MGVSMSSEEIEALLSSMNQSRAEVTITEKEDNSNSK
jgi:hypothetical protein